MSWLEDIGNYLHTQNVGTVGTDIFYNGFHVGATNCITLLDQPGRGENVTLSKDMELERPELGIRIINSSSKSAKTKAEEIYNLLNLKVNTVIGSTHFKRIEAISPPFLVSNSLTEGTIYSINFLLQISK